MELYLKSMDVTELFVCESGEVRKCGLGEVTGGLCGVGKKIKTMSSSAERKMRSHLQSLAERGRAGRTDLVGAQVDGRHRLVRL